MIIRALFFFLLFFISEECLPQSFSLFYHSAKLLPDTVLVRAGTTDSMELTTFLTIVNDAIIEKQIQAKKTEFTMVPGTASSLCWAGYCYPPEIFVTDYPLVLAPGAGETSCFAHFISGGIVGTSIVRWTFFDEANPSDSVSVLIEYITYPMGVGNSNANSKIFAAPNPADGAVFFKANDLNSAYTVTLCSLSGNALRQGTAAGNDGTLKIGTSDLPSGIYLYSVSSGGKMIGSGKLAISH